MKVLDQLNTAIRRNKEGLDHYQSKISNCTNPLLRASYETEITNRTELQDKLLSKKARMLPHTQSAAAVMAAQTLFRN